MLINYISNNPSILYLFLVAFAFWPKVKPHPIDRRSGCSWSLQMRWWLVGIAFIGVSDACLVIFQPMEVTNYELTVPFFRFFSGYFRICSTSKWWSVSIPNLTGNLTQKDIIVSIKRVKRLIFPLIFNGFPNKKIHWFSVSCANKGWAANVSTKWHSSVAIRSSHVWGP